VSQSFRDEYEFERRAANEIHLNLIKKTNPNVKKIYPAMQQKMLN
jgi:hypothetical protein